MAVDVLLGLQWGDEGKGKIVDYLADKYDIVARFQGGPNAGHTIIINDQKFVLHTIPSGVFRDNIINVIGNGVVIDPITLEKEIQGLAGLGVDVKNRLLISNKAHLILPTHRLLDAASEAAKGKNKIGSTLRGIGPTYMDKTGRNGLRVGNLTKDFDKKYKAIREKHLKLLKIYPEIEFDLEAEEQKWMSSLDALRSLSKVNAEYYFDNALQSGKNILAEGAQGSMLDVDFGTYPFVTSSNTITAGVCTGMGIAPQKIRDVIGITKAYCTRVGSGPFPTEIHNEAGETLRKIGGEFGATTGRPRRCGWIDLPQLKYTIMINGVTKLVVTKIDVLNSFDSFKAADSYLVAGEETKELPFDLHDSDLRPKFIDFKGWGEYPSGASYDQMPDSFKNYITYLSKELGVHVPLVSIGPERNELLEL